MEEKQLETPQRGHCCPAGQQKGEALCSYDMGMGGRAG